ncbi:MAG TPA: hypothetical protein VJU61_27125, partial [Polyangiaceae bacterium]|nr:hypothetical protein [Polyangiaceae bacterium]
CSVAAPAWAQEAAGRGAPARDAHEEARALAYAGVEAYEAGDFVAADQKLRRAYALVPVPAVGLWSARALLKLNRLVEASRRYLDVSRSSYAAGDADVQKEAKRDAERELQGLLPRIPRLRIELKAAAGGDVRVTIDGIPTATSALSEPILVNPGDHWVEAQQGTLRSQAQLTLAAGETKSAQLELDGAATSSGLAGTELPLAESRASGSDDLWRTVGWVGVGVGGATLVGSALAGIIAYSQLSEFDCDGDTCQSDNATDVATYNGLRTFSTIGYITGSVLTGAGIFLLLQHRTPDAELSFRLGPGSATLGGRF